MSHFKTLIFGLDTLLHHAGTESTHSRHRVIKNLIAKIAGTAVEGSHLWHWGSIRRLQTLIGSHTYCSTR